MAPGSLVYLGERKTARPAALITGNSGMNFKRMPLLDAPEGFLISLSMMGWIALVMAVIFRRRRWLG